MSTFFEENKKFYENSEFEHPFCEQLKSYKSIQIQFTEYNYSNFVPVLIEKKSKLNSQ